MPSIVRSIRSLRCAGIIAEYNQTKDLQQFLRYNLVYGFNGSGKSTLSRIFSSLQAGYRDPRLPPNCTFEIEMDNGTIFSCPSEMNGLEQRIAVFNADFVEQNLQWSSARANPVFYIGREQAALGDKLRDLEANLPIADERRTSSSELVSSRDRALSTFKRERARMIADCLRLPGRRYEAPQLTDDYASVEFGASNLLDNSQLDSATATCRLEEAMPTLSGVSFQTSEFTDFIGQVCSIISKRPGLAIMDDLTNYPHMMLWMRDGADFHYNNDLADCLLCAGPISRGRLDAIRQALDNAIDEFLLSLDALSAEARRLLSKVSEVRSMLPRSDDVDNDLRSVYGEASEGLLNALMAMEKIVSDTVGLLQEKRLRPALAFTREALLAEVELEASKLDTKLKGFNDVIQSHNYRAEVFAQTREEARLSVKRHFLADGATIYEALMADREAAVKAAESAERAYTDLQTEIVEVASRIREHGVAAQKINSLVQSYLGHSELSISPIAEGYEIRRHGRVVEGMPSEGEKTAIAICYFIATLESMGRIARDLIVVVDDPISSLDSRALNFACTIVRGRLSEVSQLFVLTHNQQCMNEFKKAWKNQAREDTDRQPSAALLFLDVAFDKMRQSRSSKLVTMPRLIREYDSEYHYLIYHMLRFAESGDAEYEYEYMMPNVPRRVLKVFMAFRFPGNAPLVSKIQQASILDSSIDADRARALERLTQVESHSDNLDDLIGFSSMTLEETRDATEALVSMMERLDGEHVRGLRRICRSLT